MDKKTVEHFGDEWSRFDQSELGVIDRDHFFEHYFGKFPWESLPPNAVGFDAGCGSGRWAKLVAPRVGHLHCIDASAEVLAVARRNLADVPNCTFHQASIQDLAFENGSMDFGYSLGVLHHMPDTAAAMAACTAKLKPGAPFVVYLYYSFENRPRWFAMLWRGSDLMRRAISKSPRPVTHAICDVIAATVYLPLARIASGCKRLGFDVKDMPLQQYRGRSFYTMRTDALDRFGTPLEQRFSSAEVRDMMTAAGLEQIVFGEEAFWVAVGTKRRTNDATDGKS